MNDNHAKMKKLIANQTAQVTSLNTAILQPNSPSTPNPPSSPSNTSIPQVNTPLSNTANPQINIPQGIVVPNQFHPYANQTLFAYPPREKLELSKFDENEKQGLA
jgi:hypothetical protein